MSFQLEVIHRKYNSVSVLCFDSPDTFLSERIIVGIAWRSDNTGRLYVMTTAGLRQINENKRGGKSITCAYSVCVEKYGERGTLCRNAGR